MSDLIARLEDLADEIVDQDGYPCSDYWQCVHETLAKDFRSAAAALRQKEAEIAELRADRDSWADQADARVTDAVQALERARAAEAQLSALRDQQPVAREPFGYILKTDMGDAYYKRNERVQARRDARALPGSELIPLYAHPSCVSPDKPQAELLSLSVQTPGTGDTSGVASDQPKRLPNP